jgi:ComF family protein
MVLRLKFGGRAELARPLGRLMADLWRGEPRLGPVDGVLPVPLHWVRERRRGYNQALLLAKDFGRRTETPLWDGVLRRKRSTKPQTELGRESRRANVEGAFEVKRPERVRGKSLLLVDDVCTTGATLEACARALKAAGARRVGALTAARHAPT